MRDDDVNATGAPDPETVRFDFMVECPRPTRKDVELWQERFPQLAAEIAEWAGIIADNLPRAVEGTPESFRDDPSVRREVARAMRELYPDAADEPTLLDVIASAGASPAEIAAEVGIDQAVLAEALDGVLTAPGKNRLVSVLASRLTRTRRRMSSLLDPLEAVARAGHADASSPPTRTLRTFRQAILESGMPAERKDYWLADG